jgi:organic hydroperoxide reductase OsmC/OhrA
MGQYTAVVLWERNGAAFTDNRYSRGHRWRFDGGIEVPASSSPLSVPVPLSVAEAVDPEEAFVASLSSCHMLWFLSIAAKRGFLIERYRDEAVGERMPSRGELDAMHHEAHERCFIANSVKTDVRCEPVVGEA